MTVLASVVDVLSHRDRIDDQLWNRLVDRIVADENMERSLAERVMNETLGFLRLCAEDPEAAHSPSTMVDIGWHTFILYTREYAAFCEREAGRFIHHNPSDVPGIEYPKGRSALTVTAMRGRGIPVDLMLWTNVAGCDKGDVCDGDGYCDGKDG